MCLLGFISSSLSPTISALQKNTASFSLCFEGDQPLPYLPHILDGISGALPGAALNPGAPIVMLVSLRWDGRESECSAPWRQYPACSMLTLLLRLAYFDRLVFFLLLMYSKVWTLSLSGNLILLSFKCSEGQWIFSSAATWTAGALEIVVATAASVVTVLP